MHSLNWISTDKHVRFASRQQESADALFTMANQTITTTPAQFRGKSTRHGFSPQLCFFLSSSAPQIALQCLGHQKLQNQLRVTMKVYKTWIQIYLHRNKIFPPSKRQRSASKGWDLRLFYDKHKYTNCMRTTLLRLQTAARSFHLRWLNQTRPKNWERCRAKKRQIGILGFCRVLETDSNIGNNFRTRFGTISRCTNASSGWKT